MDSMDASMLSLPDDALLSVLEYLPPRMLFTCRAVCRRLRDMCLHPHLWRCVQLETGGVLLAALRLAPCLGAINFEGLNASLTDECIKTACIVEELDLFVHNDSAVMFASAIVKKFSTLGGLRKIKIELLGLGTGERDLPALVQEVLSVANLRELRVFTPTPLTVLPSTDSTPSLKSLYYGGACFNVDPLLEWLLRTHTLTLEHVSLRTSSLPVSLIKGIAGLRSLSCFVSEDLAKLATLPNLDTVDLWDFAVEDFPSEAVHFLLQAPHLRSVTLPLPTKHPMAPLLALAGHRIETLELRCASAVVDLVASALHLFPALKNFTLSRCKPSNYFLKSVSCTSLPHLSSLTVWSRHSCPHAWLHDPAVQDLLVRNPLLHLRVPKGESIPEGCDCPWCLWGCHATPGFRANACGGFAFSSHSRRAGCPRGCFQVAGMLRPSCARPSAPPGVGPLT